MNTKLRGIVLAAGKSTRINTGNSKLLKKICGQEMILYSTRLLASLEIPTTVVIGYQKEKVTDVVTSQHKNTIDFVTQEAQNGTGHAVICTQNTWDLPHILIMNGDVPLVTQDIIQNLYDEHTKTDAAISFVTAHKADYDGCSYGRVIQTDDNIQIIEAKEFNGDITKNCCINAGIYIVKKEFLQQHITTIQNNNTSKEFYLTDLVKIASDNGLTVTTTSAPFDRIRGINTLQELWAVEQIAKSDLIKYWMKYGVYFAVPQSVNIDFDVTIGAGTRIGCGTYLLRGTKIGTNCTIGSFSSFENATIADDATIEAHCIVRDSTIGSSTHVGPFAHVRNNSIIEDHATIGNFVEIKNSIIGRETKAKHLTYLGDAHVGSRVNIGAGTITCNHNGKNKNHTTIKDDAYIGSNNSLVAPVTIEKNAFTAAGSVITHDVPEDALAIARQRQTNKEGYAKKLRTKKKENNFSFIGAIKTTHDDTTTEGL